MAQYTVSVESSTASLGNLFQYLATFTLKNFFPKSRLNFLPFSLYPLLLVLSLQFLMKSPFPALLQSPFRCWRISVGSPWNFLCKPGDREIYSPLGYMVMRKLRKDPKQHKLETSSQHWLEDFHPQFIASFLHQVPCPSLGATCAQARWVWQPSLTDVLCPYLLPYMNRRASLPVLSFLYSITSQTGPKPGNTRAPALSCNHRFPSCTTSVGPDSSLSTASAANSHSLHVEAFLIQTEL